MTSTLERKIEQALAQSGTTSSNTKPVSSRTNLEPGANNTQKEEHVEDGSNKTVNDVKAALATDARAPVVLSTQTKSDEVKPAPTQSSIASADTTSTASIDSLVTPTKISTPVSQPSCQTTDQPIQVATHLKTSKTVNTAGTLNGKRTPTKKQSVPEKSDIAAPPGTLRTSQPAEPAKTPQPTKAPKASSNTMTTPEAMQRLYNQALERNRRMEALMQQSPADCTFTPELVASKSRNARSPASGQPVRVQTFESLYADSLVRNRKQKEQLEQALANPEGCTFSPAVNKSKLTRSAPGKVSHGSALRRSQALYEESKLRRSKQEELRKHHEESDTPTFKPKISRRAKRAPSPGPAARMEQLYQTNKGRNDRLEAERQSREMAGCTFKPKINKRGRSVPRQRLSSTNGQETQEVNNSGEVKNTQPAAGRVQDRLAKYKADVDRKREELRRLQKEKEDKELTFKPNVGRARSRGRARERSSKEISNSKNGSTVSAAPDEGQIHSRLYQDARKKEEIAAKLRSKLDEESGLTFQPNVNHKRRSASARRSRPDVEGTGAKDGSVFERLNNQSREFRAQHMKREEEKLLREMQECTFKPKVNVEHMKVGADAKEAPAQQEDSTPIWERLHKEHADVAQLREEIKKQQELDGCTFSPTISHTPPKKEPKGSKSASQTSTPVYTRLAEQGKHSAERAKQLEDQKAKDELSKCTFQPKVSKSSAAMVHTSAPVWRRLASKKELPEKTKVVAKELRDKKLSECTFQPKVNPTSVLILENPQLLMASPPPTAAKPNKQRSSSGKKAPGLTPPGSVANSQVSDAKKIAEIGENRDTAGQKTIPDSDGGAGDTDKLRLMPAGQENEDARVLQSPTESSTAPATISQSPVVQHDKSPAAAQNGVSPVAQNRQSPAAAQGGLSPVAQNGQSPAAAPSGQSPVVQHDKSPAAAQNGMSPVAQNGQSPAAAQSSQSPTAQSGTGASENFSDMNVTKDSNNLKVVKTAKHEERVWPNEPTGDTEPSQNSELNDDLVEVFENAS